MIRPWRPRNPPPAVQAASANVNAAEQQVIQARGKLDQAQANLRTAGTGPKQVAAIRSRAAAAEAEVQRREADLDQAQLNLTYTHVVRSEERRVGKECR